MRVLVYESVMPIESRTLFKKYETTAIPFHWLIIHCCISTSHISAIPDEEKLKKLDLRERAYTNHDDSALAISWKRISKYLLTFTFRNKTKAFWISASSTHRAWQ